VDIMNISQEEKEQLLTVTLALSANNSETVTPV